MYLKFSMYAFIDFLLFISESIKKAIKDTDDAVKKINSTLDAGAKVLAEQKIELEKNKKEKKKRINVTLRAH